MHMDTCQFFKAYDMDFYQFLDGCTISIFSHNRDIIYNMK